MGKTHPSLRTALRSGLHTKCTFASIPVALHLTKWEWSVGGFKPCENLRHSGWWLSPMMVCEFRWTMVNKPSWDISWNINGIIPPLTSTNHAIINNPLTNHLLILTGFHGMPETSHVMWSWCRQQLPFGDGLMVYGSVFVPRFKKNEPIGGDHGNGVLSGENMRKHWNRTNWCKLRAFEDHGNE